MVSVVMFNVLMIYCNDVLSIIFVILDEVKLCDCFVVVDVVVIIKLGRYFIKICNILDELGLLY